MKILVLITDSKPFRAVEPFLAPQDMEMTYVPNLIEAIQKIQTETWDVILISWNLPLINVKKCFEFFDSKLESMVVVFSESNKPQVIKSLMASQINRTMYPPLSGPGVVNRLQTLYNQRHPPDEERGEIGLVAVEARDVPQDIVWEAAPPAPGQAADGEKFWQGVSHKDESSTYVFQGIAPPKWDKRNKTWAGIGDRAILKVSNQARSAMGGVLGQTIQKKPKLKVLGVEKAEKKYQPPATSAKDGSTTFHNILADAVEIIKGVFCDPHDVGDDVTKVAFTWIQADSMAGIVLVGDPAQSQDALELLEGFQTGLRSLSDENDEKFELLINKSIVSIKPTNPNLWMSRKTKYVYGVQSPQNKMIMAYIPIDHDLGYALDETGQYYAIAVEKAFRPGAKTPCEFFVFMKKNQKHVRYIGKGQVIQESTITKLTNKQITTVFFLKRDLDAFLKYKSIHYLGLSK